MSNSVPPHRWQPTRLCNSWDSPGKNTGVGCHFLLQCMKVKRESEAAQSCPTPWTAAYQAPLFMGFSRQEYWSGVPFTPHQNLPVPNSGLNDSPSENPFKMSLVIFSCDIFFLHNTFHIFLLYTLGFVCGVSVFPLDFKF